MAACLSVCVSTLCETPLRMRNGQRPTALSLHTHSLLEFLSEFLLGSKKFSLSPFRRLFYVVERL